MLDSLATQQGVYELQTFPWTTRFLCVAFLLKVDVCSIPVVLPLKHTCPWMLSCENGYVLTATFGDRGGKRVNSTFCVKIRFKFGSFGSI